MECFLSRLQGKSVNSEEDRVVYRGGSKGGFSVKALEYVLKQENTHFSELPTLTMGPSPQTNIDDGSSPKSA